MITDLASNERYEDVLQGIVALDDAGPVIAGGAMLALEPRAGRAPQGLLRGSHRRGSGRRSPTTSWRGVRAQGRGIAVDVTSARRHYGVLAIGEHGGIFTSQAQGTLETYARLAAAALDAADALEEARHQANTAQVLLELSTSLAEIVSTEEMASKVVRAVPDVIDCDRVAVCLDDGSWQGCRRREASGWSLRTAIPTMSRSPARRGLSRRRGGRWTPNTGWWSARAVRSRSPWPSVVRADQPSSGKTIGYIVASVTSNPSVWPSPRGWPIA